MQMAAWGVARRVCLYRCGCVLTQGLCACLNILYPHVLAEFVSSLHFLEVTEVFYHLRFSIGIGCFTK